MESKCRRHGSLVAPDENRWGIWSCIENYHRCVESSALSAGLQTDTLHIPNPKEKKGMLLNITHKKYTAYFTEIADPTHPALQPLLNFLNQHLLKNNT